MNRDSLAEAKLHLRIPELWHQLGLPGKPGKSCRCPWREDHKPSFSVFNNGVQWKDFGTDEKGDAIDFLARVRGISNTEACREFLRLANNGNFVARSSPRVPSFSWSACVAALTAKHRGKLAERRGYSPEFVEWLLAHNLVGLFDNQYFAFPVHGPEGAVVGCHYRLEDNSWRFHPSKLHVRSLVIGDPKSATQILVFESQWDGLAVMDKLVC